MRYEFHVKELGLVLNDGRMAMPGSVIFLTAPAPAHWARFGKTSSVPAKGAEEPRKLEVASPSPGKDSQGSMLDGLRASYEELTGKSADKRWKEDRLNDEIAKALES